jgi:hypothetical protein
VVNIGSLANYGAPMWVTHYLLEVGNFFVIAVGNFMVDKNNTLFAVDHTRVDGLDRDRIHMLHEGFVVHLVAIPEIKRAVFQLCKDVAVSGGNTIGFAA